LSTNLKHVEVGRPGSAHLLVAAAVCLIAAAAIFWASLSSVSANAAGIYFLFAAASCGVNQHILGTGWFSWVNVYLILSLIAVAGYPVLIQAHLATAETWMPDVVSQGTHAALAVAGLAILAIEIGALCSYFIRTSPRENVKRDLELIARLLRRIGIVITVASGILIFNLLRQLGGLGALSGGYYTQYMSNLLRSSPAFGTLGVTYFPLGLITFYLGLLLGEQGSRSFRRRRLLVIAAYIGFALTFLQIGDRNAPLIAGVSLVYIHHHFGSRLRVPQFLVLLLVGLIALAVVGQFRNSAIAGSAGTQSSAVTQALGPVIGTFRPFENFIVLFSPESGSQAHLGSLPYVSALKEVLPFYSRLNPKESLFRSSTLITNLVNPSEARANIYEGGSNIGEAYAAGGPWYVFITSLLLSFFIASIERRALLGHGIVALCLMALSFSFWLFYIRDDVFAAFRNVVWALALGGAMAIHFTFKQRRARSARVRRPSTSKSALY
jgi:oligosaccharide repeat unit polymerase